MRRSRAGGLGQILVAPPRTGRRVNMDVGQTSSSPSQSPTVRTTRPRSALAKLFVTNRAGLLSHDSSGRGPPLLSACRGQSYLLLISGRALRGDKRPPLIYTSNGSQPATRPYSDGAVHNKFGRPPRLVFWFVNARPSQVIELAAKANLDHPFHCMCLQTHESHHVLLLHSPFLTALRAEILDA